MRNSSLCLLMSILAVGIAVASVPESPAGFSDPLDIDNKYHGAATASEASKRALLSAVNCRCQVTR